MISEHLAGKRIAITGSTGFVGTALVERLLRSVPDCELVLLVRPSKRHDPAERVRREIFKNNCFDRLKAELRDGDETFEAMVARRASDRR
ncbi:MAG: SDR family oxidoreductase [Ilumatobacteraceae bacterium]